MTSEADEAIGLLCRLVQLAQPGQLPAGGEVCRGSPIALRLAGIQHTATQAGRDADHAIQLVGGDEAAPLRRDIQFVLGRDDVRRGAVYAVLVEEQATDLMAASQRGFGEAQRATRGR